MRRQQRRRVFFLKTHTLHIHPDPLLCVLIQKGVFVSREWSEALARLDIFPDPTAGQAHHQLGDVERTIQTLKRSAVKLHEIHPSLSAERVVSRVTSIHNQLDRIKGYSPFQCTFARSRLVWNTEAHDSTNPFTMETEFENQNGRSQCLFAHTCPPKNLGTRT